MSPETISGLRLLLALVFTLCLFGLVVWLMRYYGEKISSPAKNSNSRLGVLETRMIDTRHRLVLVRRDDREHLLLLTNNAPPLVVESGISRASNVANPLGPAR